MAKPLLSVIVTTYDEGRLADVFSLFESLKAQTYPHVEVVFVGERTPSLGERVRAHADALGMTNVKVLFNDGAPGLSPARNVGILNAHGEMIAFLDDDVVAFPTWAEALVRVFEESGAIGVTGPALPLWDDPAMAWLPPELHWLISCTNWNAWDAVREVRNAWGMNMAFRAGAFAKAGLFFEGTGYHLGPIAEDNEFSQRVRATTGERIVYAPDAKVYHRVHAYRLTWSFVRERSHWIGRSRRNLRRLYGAEVTTAVELLDPERQLLRRLLLRRIPAEVARLTYRPRVAFRRLSMLAWALTWVGFGYYGHLLPGRKSDGALAAITKETT